MPRFLILRPRTNVVGPLGVLIAAGSIVVFTCGTAYAYIRSGSGSGSGTAAAAAVRNIGFAVTGQAGGPLFPGASGNVNVSISNPYAQPITLTGLTGTVSTDQGGCTNADFTIAASPSGLPSTLTASQAATAYTLTNAVTMKTSAADACRGAHITVTLSVTGRL